MIRLPFLIILVTHFLVVACHSSDQERIHQENLSLQNETMLDFVEVEYEALKRRTERQLNDPTKYEFLPILPALEEVEIEIEKILSELSKIKAIAIQQDEIDQSIESFVEVADTSLNKIVNIHSNLLGLYGERPFGFKENEIEELLKQFSDTLKADINDWKINNLALLSNQYAQQSLDNLEWKIRLMQFELYKHFVSFSGGRATILNYYYPVINPKECMVKTNESFKADVSIGTYAAVDPQYFELFVNGELIKANSSGIAELRIPPTDKTGTKVLQLRAIIHNPYNYQSRSFESTFEYEVIEK